MTDKVEALEAIRNLCEHATLAEIIENLSILEMIRRGQLAAEAGNVVSHEEAESRLESWITRSAGLVPR